MASASGQIADLVLRGWSPRQHHDPGWALSQRIVTYSCRAVRSQTSDPDFAPQYEDGTLGDDVCWAYWPAKDRAHGAWSVSFPTVLTSGTTKGLASCFQKGKKGKGKTKARGSFGSVELVPLKGARDPDGSFKPKVVKPLLPSFAGQYPKDWTGIFHGGTDHAAQGEVWSPDFLGLVAPTRAGDPKTGTRVFDTTKSGGIDPKRWREISSLISVVEVGGIPCVPPGMALALNIGHGGSLEASKPGYLPIVDWDKCEIGFSNNDFGGGPLLVNDKSKTCQHNFGANPQGLTNRPLHLSTTSLFLFPNQQKDAPLNFEPIVYDPDVKDEGDFWRVVHLRFDAQDVHSACNKSYTGKWKWQVRDAYKEIPGTGLPPPEDGPGVIVFPKPKPKPPKPEGKPIVPGSGGVGTPITPKPPKPPRPPRVCQPGDNWGAFYPAFGQCVAMPGRIGAGRSARRGDPDITGWSSDGTTAEGDRLTDLGPPSTSGNTGAEADRANDPGANIGDIARGLRLGVGDIVDSRPLVTEDATVSRGCTEGKPGWHEHGTPYRGHNVTTGGDCFLPWGVKFAELVEGLFDLISGTKAWDGHQVIRYFPGGLSSVGFCHPRDSDSMTGAGVVMQQVATGMEMIIRGAAGVATGDKVNLNVAGSPAVSITGGLEVDGVPVPGTASTSGAFGGTGALGNTTISSNTQSANVPQNYADFVLNVGINYYPIIGELLTTLVSGDFTWNGILLLAGKGAVGGAGGAGSNASNSGAGSADGSDGTVGGITHMTCSAAAGSAGGGSGAASDQPSGAGGDGLPGESRNLLLGDTNETGDGGDGGAGAAAASGSAGNAGTSGGAATAYDLAAYAQRNFITSRLYSTLIRGGSPGPGGGGGSGGVNVNGGVDATAGGGGSGGDGTGTSVGDGANGGNGGAGGGALLAGAGGGGGGGGAAGGGAILEVAGVITAGGSSSMNADGGDAGDGGNGGAAGSGAEGGGGGGAAGGGAAGMFAGRHLGALTGSPSFSFSGGTGGSAGAGGSGTGGAGGAGGNGGTAEDGYAAVVQVGA